MQKQSLGELYETHQGKVSDKWSRYIRLYDDEFLRFRTAPIRILEIGVQNGGSLEILSQYFPNAERIIGCDIDPLCGKLTFDDPKIKVFVGDAGCRDIAKSIIEEGPFDIVVDDGSHKSSDIVKAFCLYFPHIRDDGVFIAEDLHASYWEAFEGGLHHPFSSMAFFKGLADVINVEHWGNKQTSDAVVRGIAEHYAAELDAQLLARVDTVSFANSVCVVRAASEGVRDLGSRVIAGTRSDVTDTDFSLNGTERSQTNDINETGNPWALRGFPPAEELAALSDALAKGWVEVPEALLKSDVGQRIQHLVEQQQATEEGRLKLEEALAAERARAEAGEAQAAELEAALKEQRLKTQADLHAADLRIEAIENDVSSANAEIARLNGTFAVKVSDRLKKMFGGKG